MHKGKSVYFSILYNFCLVTFSLKYPRGPEPAHGTLLWPVAHGRGVQAHGTLLWPVAHSGLALKPSFPDHS